MPDWLAVILRHKTYMALFGAAAVASFALTPLYIFIARRFGLVDRPGGRKQHPADTPTMGGLVVFAVVFAGAAAAFSMGNRVSEMLRPHGRYVLAAALCTAVMMIVGILDDRVRLRPRSKLLVQGVLAVAAFLLGFRIEALTIPWLGSTPIGLAPISLVLSLLWIVGITNAINLTDGLDGLAAGVCFLAAGTNAVVAIYLENYYMAVMMILLSGSLLGFLRWNFHPARVFLGDTGSLGLGMFMALCSLHSAQKAHTAVMLLVPLCALGYPIFDTLLAVARRTVAGQPLFSPDREHIHHRLASRGYGASGAALRIYAGSLALIGIGVLLSSVNHFAVGMGLLCVLGLALFSVRVLGYLEWAGWSDVVRDRRENKLLHAAAELARLKIRASKRVDDVLAGLGVFATEIGVAAIEIDVEGDTHRWVRFGAASGSRSTEPLQLGPRTARIELPAGVSIDPRGTLLWEDVCGLAAEQLESYCGGGNVGDGGGDVRGSDGGDGGSATQPDGARVTA